MRKEEEIVKKDIEALYLGNLNTVEFDLKLPAKGKFGSDITWESEHEVYLRSDGKVRRPSYGMGDRLYSLWGTFTYGGYSERKEYKVCILEDKPTIKVCRTEQIVVKAEPEKKIYLPSYIVVYTEAGETLMHPVNWENGSDRMYEEEGRYTENGILDGLDVSVTAEVEVSAQNRKKKRDKTPRLHFFDHGEAALEGTGRLIQAQEEMKQFLLHVSDDQMLFNFREAAGLDTKGAPEMIGWDAPECKLKGHTTGHYLSALALCFKATKDKEIHEKAVSMIEELGKCQQALEQLPGIHKGFLSGYSEEQFDQLEEFVPYPTIWAPYYTLHKILAGLLDCYEFAGIHPALKMAEGIGSWVSERLSHVTREKRLKMWSTYIAGEYGGMNDAMARLYAITGKEEYLETARLFDNEKLFLQMEERIDALDKMHANQHIPQIVGAMQMFKATGEKDYYDLSAFFWETVVGRRTYANGGTGEGEMFHQADCIGNMLTSHTTESCASYNMLKLTKELYAFDGGKRFMDYYERTMFNHILASKEHGTSGESLYFTPLSPGGKKTFLRENSCCHGTGMESHFKYADMIYAAEGNSLLINLFVESSLQWKEKGIQVRQRCRMEEPGRILLEIKSRTDFELRIRRPYWSETNGTITDSHSERPEIMKKEGYLCFTVPAGESEYQILFPCTYAVESPQDRPDLGVLKYGPYVLAAVKQGEEYLEIREDKQPERVCGLRFRYEGMIWKPLFDIEEEEYHVYWKKKKE